MREDPLVSIIIPVWRDDTALPGALRAAERRPVRSHDGAPGDGCALLLAGRNAERQEASGTPHTLQDAPAVEVIVVPSLGEEPRYAMVRDAHPGVCWVSAPRGRAAQMNAGAAAARGRWLLFLHADSRLPAEWLDVIMGADARETIVAGAFRLALDSSDLRARVIEAGARLRVLLAGLPYGDQGLFVRMDVFRALGGYRDLPLMEDVDFMRRVKVAGRVLQSRSAVLTSARRWERDGWIRRTTQNARLAARFLFGASPARLAQQYLGRKPAAVVLMARAPWTGGKTRLGTADNGAAHEHLQHALFLDTLDVVRSVPDVEHIIACEPAAACERMRAFAGPAVDVVAQRGRDLGERLMHLFEDVFRLGVESIVVVGSDLPDLPSRLVRGALAALGGGDDRVVLGPAADGGYYLIGLNRPHPSLFERIDWSTERVLAQTLDAAKSARLPCVLLDQWADVDDDAALRRILDETDASTAPRTRAWGLEHFGRRPENFFAIPESRH